MFFSYSELHRVHISDCKLLVLNVCSQGGGTTGAHSWQAKSQSIGAVLWIPMQLYEPRHRRTFRSVFQASATLQAYSFSLVNADNFLQRLLGIVMKLSDLRQVEVDLDTYEALSDVQKAGPKAPSHSYHPFQLPCA